MTVKAPTVMIASIANGFVDCGRIYWSCACVAPLAGFLSAFPDWKEGIAVALFLLCVMVVIAYVYTPHIKFRGNAVANALIWPGEPLCTPLFSCHGSPPARPVRSSTSRCLSTCERGQPHAVALHRRDTGPKTPAVSWVDANRLAPRSATAPALREKSAAIRSRAVSTNIRFLLQPRQFYRRAFADQRRNSLPEGLE